MRRGEGEDEVDPHGSNPRVRASVAPSIVQATRRNNWGEEIEDKWRTRNTDSEMTEEGNKDGMHNNEEGAGRMYGRLE